jgi:hypothetical protein
MQYNWKNRKYRNGRKQSRIFDNVVPDKVSVKLDPLMWYPYTKKQTPFKGVTLASFEPEAEFNLLLRSLYPVKQNLVNIWNEFKGAIFDGWMPNKIHVIGASSGYDSRLIAKAVQELTKQHGTDWLGETYFVECAGESEGFMEIMKTLGWEDRTIIWEPDFSFDYFKNLHRRFNGLCAYPMNQWYDFYVKNWNENDIQYISGYGGNVADVINDKSPYMGDRKHRHRLKGRLMMYFRHQYFYQISAFRQPKYSLHPFWSWRYIKSVSGVNHPIARTSVLLATKFVPECKHVKRMTILGEVTDNGHRTVKPKVVKELQEWYNETAYGKRYHCQASNLIEYNKWWLQLCIANYAEANNISVH